MHRIRHVVIAASVAALALAALGAPLSAANPKGTLGILNGIPNERVDICLNGKELRSAARYGQGVTKVAQAGNKTVEIYRKDPRTCRGTKLGQKTLFLDALGDYTLVITKKAPKWAMFDNAGLGQIWPVGVAVPGFYLVVRHAADLGTVNMRLVQQASSPVPGPSADSPWVKGDQWAYGFISPIPPTVKYGFAAGRVDNPKNFVTSKIMAYDKTGFRLEYYLLGTWAGNAEIIIWKRPVTNPGP